MKRYIWEVKFVSNLAALGLVGAEYYMGTNVKRPIRPLAVQLFLLPLPFTTEHQWLWVGSKGDLSTSPWKFGATAEFRDGERLLQSLEHKGIGQGHQDNVSPSEPSRIVQEVPRSTTLPLVQNIFNL